jgi:hypothetical protein
MKGVVAPGHPYLQVEAENYDSMSGIQAETCSDTNQGYAVAFIENGDYAVYKNMNFASGANSFQARVSSLNNGGTIEVHLDSLSGTLVGTCTVAGTGGWQTWVTKSCNIAGASGIHTLYLKFTGGSGYLFNFNWYKFVAGNPTATRMSMPTPGSSLNRRTGWTPSVALTTRTSPIAPSPSLPLYDVSGKRVVSGSKAITNGKRAVGVYLYRIAR